MRLRRLNPFLLNKWISDALLSDGGVSAKLLAVQCLADNNYKLMPRRLSTKMDC